MSIEQAKGENGNSEELVLRKVSALQNASFIQYLNSRGIPLVLAKRYLKDFHVHNKVTGRDFHAFGLRNVNEGYEVRNHYFNGCIGSKGISLIRGRKILPQEVHVFKNVMDFLSALASQRTSRFDGDAILLNDVTSLSQAFPYIKNYSYKVLHTWLDNNKAGKAATKALHDFAGQQGNLFFNPMNEIYAPHKDVNTWHRRRFGL